MSKISLLRNRMMTQFAKEYIYNLVHDGMDKGHTFDALKFLAFAPRMIETRKEMMHESIYTSALKHAVWLVSYCGKTWLYWFSYCIISNRKGDTFLDFATSPRGITHKSTEPWVVEVVYEWCVQLVEWKGPSQWSMEEDVPRGACNR